MKKWIVVGSLAAGLLALGAWRMRQSKKNPEDEFAIPDDFAVPTAQDEPVGVSRP
jgi:hypothetical protein